MRGERETIIIFNASGLNYQRRTRHSNLVPKSQKYVKQGIEGTLSHQTSDLALINLSIVITNFSFNKKV